MRIEPATCRLLSPYMLKEPTPITVTPCVLLVKKFRQYSMGLHIIKPYRKKGFGNNYKKKHIYRLWRHIRRILFLLEYLLKFPCVLYASSSSSSSCRAARHPSLLFIALCRSFRLHPTLAQKCCRQGLAGCATFARQCEGDHRSTSLMFVLTSPAVSCMSGSSNLDSFHDGR